MTCPALPGVAQAGQGHARGRIPGVASLNAFITRGSRARTALLVAPALAASLALSACGGGSDAKGSASQTPSSAAPTPEYWPFTGVQAPLGTTTKLNRAPLVVKMDNTEASAPQLGLSKADLIVEELVEGGLTRLAAFYYENLPGTVGPVRSMRASDIGIVAPAGADVVTSGAAAVTIKRIKAAGITFFEQGSKGISRDTSRRAPYNLFSKLTATATLAERDPETVDPYLPFGDPAQFAGTEPVSSFTVPFSWSHTTRWTYQDGHYVNTNSNAKRGDEFTPDSVLVLRVRIGDAGYKDPAGNPVPETKLNGTGKALLFHGGKVVRGTWSKSSEKAPLQLATETGALSVPTGHTWIELVPNDGPALGLTP